MGFDVRKLMDDNLRAWRNLAGDVEVLLRYIPRPEYEAIEKDCMQFKYTGGVKNEERNDKEFRRLLGKATVLDWKNIVDGDKPYPCTPEAIEYLMEECSEFRLLVLQTPFNLAWFLAQETPQGAAQDKAKTDAIATE